MTEKNNTCKVEMLKYYGSNPCERQGYDNKGMCICHSNDEDKNIGLFQEEIDKIFSLRPVRTSDFSYFIFPVKGWSFKRGVFERDSIFRHSKFLGEVNFVKNVFSGSVEFHNTIFLSESNFMSARFSQGVDFDGARFFGKAVFTAAFFNGSASFDSTQFSRQAIFSAVKFNGDTHFHSTRFLDDASFDSTEYSDDAHFESTYFEKEPYFGYVIARSDSHILFDGERLHQNLMWKEGANLTGFKIEKDAIVTFRKVSMQGVQLLESNISRMEFIDVKWPRTSRLHKRRTVADEMVERQKDYPLIAQVYQGLQENYANWYRYLEAGDFFVGEQEMRRKGKGKWGQYFSLNNAYRILSYYGQSMLLPLFWLLGVILLIPGMLMYGGVGLNLQDKSDIVNYDWSFDIADLVFLKSDYWQTFLFNFSFMAFSRSKMHDALTEPWQLALVNFEALVVIGLVAMSLLAVRRRFKRKNF